MTDKNVKTKLKTVAVTICTHKSYLYTEYPLYILDDIFDSYECKSLIIPIIVSFSLVKIAQYVLMIFVCQKE